MKKIYVLALSLMMVSFAFSQNARKASIVEKQQFNNTFKSGNQTQNKSVQSTFFDGFEGGFDLEGWTVLDANADTASWFVVQTVPSYGIYTYEGDSVVAIGFDPIANNDYLISPQLTVNEGEELSFWASSVAFQGTDYPEHFEVLISTTGLEAEDFTINIASVTDLPSEFTKYSYILTDNAEINDGDQIYVAIRNISPDKNIMLLDNFKLDAPSTEPIAELNETSWNAGNIEVSTSVTSTEVILTNADAGTLTITSVTNLEETNFTTTFAEGDVSLDAGETYSFTFNYNAPATAGTSSETFTIETNGGTLEFSLEGACHEACTDITVFPYTEDFESMPGEIICWETSRNTEADGGLNGAGLVDVDNWFVVNAESFSGNGATYIHGGDQAVGIGWSAPDFNWLISSNVVLPETGSYNLNFWSYIQNDVAQSWITKLHVQVYADDVWNNELTLEDGTDNLFSDEITVDLAAYAGKTIKVAFVFEFNDGYEVSIDDISISLDTNTDNINSINTSNINLFPNPTTGTVNITNTESNTVEVYNMVGQVISSLENVQKIDLSSFDNGTYIVKVISENNTVTKKVNLIK